MRAGFCILCLLLFVLASLSAQPIEQRVLRIEQLSAEGILLDKGWKFTVGDSPFYANSYYNDSKWQAVDPTKDIHKIPALWKNKIIWLRLHFRVDSALIGKLAMMVQQSGASEIYINGKLLRRFGMISTNIDKIIAYDPLGKPVPFEYVNNGINVLAIRYTLQPDLLYSYIVRQNPALFIRLNNYVTATDVYYRDVIAHDTSVIFRIGAFVILLILHLAFFLYYPAQKVNLYFSIYAAVILLGEIAKYYTISEVKYIYYKLNIISVCGHLSLFFLLTALYSLLNQKRGFIYWCFLGLTLTGIVLNAFVYSIDYIESLSIIVFLLTVEIIRISFEAVKKKQRGAWIITAGSISFFAFSFFFIYLAASGYSSKFISAAHSIGDITYNIAYLCIPVATSIYLGLEFAFTSTALKQKLTEVESLSNEKQQILAAQNEVLEQQVTQRTVEVKQSLEELKSTQAQLIQREKMASLGELTAGIAHEIQNPLNFVNNFSEVSRELVEELRQEQKKPERELPLEADLLNDLNQNLEKIHHHGLRADAIVRNMLLHSRAAAGEKQLTNLNALADEYLRLAYHGLRAKDKSFTCTLDTYYDLKLEQVKVVPQDLGRVLLNLYNNAFYAVQKKRQLVPEGSDEREMAYQPTVKVSTRMAGNQVELRVWDNGVGIPESQKSKIFQPFFTTKPTGQGTGLGLSLSYDIITKGHGGELKVETNEGEYTEMIVQLSLHA